MIKIANEICISYIKNYQIEKNKSQQELYFFFPCVIIEKAG